MTIHAMPSPATAAGAIVRPEGEDEYEFVWTVTVRVRGVEIAEVDCEVLLPMDDGLPLFDEAAFAVRDHGRLLVITRASHRALHEVLSSALADDREAIVERYIEARS